jgi:hypothetical protein
VIPLFERREQIVQWKHGRDTHSFVRNTAHPPTQRFARMTDVQTGKTRVVSVTLMPVLITIDVKRKLVLTVCTGEVRDEEFLEARKHVLDDPRFDRSFDRVWDFSAVTEANVSAATIENLVETSPFVGDVLRAVVVSISPKALTRVLEFVSRTRKFNRRIAVFPDREAAEAWIKSERAATSSLPENRGS